MTPTENHSYLLNERIVTFCLAQDPELCRQFGFELQPEMFLVQSNYKTVEASLHCVSGNLHSFATLCQTMQELGVSNPVEQIKSLRAAMSASATFDKSFKIWLPGARLRWATTKIESLKEMGVPPDEFLSTQAQIAQDASHLGSCDTGVDMKTSLEEQASLMDLLRASKGNVIQTGFTEVDYPLVGMIPGTVTVIAARPSCGKTTLACQIALLAQGNGSGPVLFNSLEMSRGRVAAKLTAMAIGENPQIYDRAYAADEAGFTEIKESLRKGESLNFRFFETHDPAALESAIMNIKPSFVVYDFLQITQTPRSYRGMRTEFVGELARNLQQIAKRRGIPILVLAQLNREGVGGTATLANLKDSGVIEEAADNVLFLERPNEAAEGADRLRAILSLKKARSGLAGSSVELMLNPRTAVFEKWNTIMAAQMVELEHQSTLENGNQRF